MRYPASEKLKIIRTVESSHLQVKQTLVMLGIPNNTYYDWYARWVEGGFDALADEAKPLERDARQFDGLGRYVEAVHGRRTGHDHLDRANVDPEGHRTRALLGAHLAVVYELRPIEVPEPFLPQIALERGQPGGLAPPGRFHYLAHIGYMEAMRSPKVWRRTTCSAPAPDRPGSPSGRPNDGRRRGGGTSRSRRGPFV